MDYKDVLAIIGVVVIMAVAMRFFPLSSFGKLGNYIKAKLPHKS